MTYAQAVARGRTLLGRSESDQWELAELTHRRTTGEGSVMLKVWAADLGISLSHASRVRAVWERFGTVVGRQSLGRTFNECYTLVKLPRARAGEVERRARRNGRTVTNEERVSRPSDRMDAAREALRDRKQCRELLADATIRRMVERELDDGPAPRPRSPRGDDLTELSAIRNRFYELLDGMLDRRLSAAERRTVAGSADAIGDAAEWMSSYATTGDRSFEDALEAVLADRDAPAPSPRRKRPVATTPETAPAEERPEPEPRTRGSSGRPKRRTPREREESTGRGSRGRRVS